MDKESSQWLNHTEFFSTKGLEVRIDGKIYYLDAREQLMWRNVGQHDIQFFVEWLLTKRTTSTSVKAKPKKFKNDLKRLNKTIAFYHRQDLLWDEFIDDYNIEEE
ncbi:hypothetical protein DDN72_17355 [Vibrio cholerae]|nr:hypothetical protein [Vibrio cholerae]